MSKNAAEQYCLLFRVRLSLVLLDASVLLWIAFAGSQIGGWVLVCFSITERRLVKRNSSKILDTVRRRLIGR
jgi:hypothetical protein